MFPSSSEVLLIISSILSEIFILLLIK